MFISVVARERIVS